jgi:hypothetical protein
MLATPFACGLQVALEREGPILVTLFRTAAVLFRAHIHGVAVLPALARLAVVPAALVFVALAVALRQAVHLLEGLGDVHRDATDVHGVRLIHGCGDLAVVAPGLGLGGDLPVRSSRLGLRRRAGRQLVQAGGEVILQFFSAALQPVMAVLADGGSAGGFEGQRRVGLSVETNTSARRAPPRLAEHLEVIHKTQCRLVVTRSGMQARDGINTSSVRNVGEARSWDACERPVLAGGERMAGVKVYTLSGSAAPLKSRPLLRSFAGGGDPTSCVALGVALELDFETFPASGAGPRVVASAMTCRMAVVAWRVYADNGPHSCSNCTASRGKCTPRRRTSALLTSAGQLSSRSRAVRSRQSQSACNAASCSGVRSSSFGTPRLGTPSLKSSL